MNTLKTFLKDENGSQFIENGLWIGLVVLALAGAGFALANTLKGKYDAINESIQGVEVPGIGGNGGVEVPGNGGNGN